MTPDEMMSRTAPDGYLLVDCQSKPRKILIQRKNAVSQSPNQDRAKKPTESVDDYRTTNEQAAVHFQTLPASSGIINQRRNFLFGGDTSDNLICCLSTKSQKDFASA
jgi:hypothetical protein